ncbi:ATP-binding Cassette (ABC) superfamily [Phytophthora infestans T30-4]|uniref:ATP-binding Cassette (ABC) superfamily n=1 Tax=Phytophthora infestans (strain T30-4) TaxID=403677 RepID=D0NI29_PHYIT|nr:ATP-binding Cassette (ABC) superfamily [Phytophthora infestans T30-4]EEY59114.1 ATP-binding Cassette (ABC) superfamily [Phytophthora infestans T30-4]|eukprot:XP_002901128.1 ATP-binding Cassette (ABC) superfamily [Phytophthora infestans T30-4]
MNVHFKHLSLSADEILKGISGVFKPEGITLLLGQPGSGKSALSKVLSGLFPIAKNITMGDVTFNNFAHKFGGGILMRRGKELLSKGSDKENFEALEATKAYFKHYPEIVIQRLGLQSCQATVIGDAMLRGVSGDERKRVTTGKMDVANTLRKNVVIALLQPSPEVISLFDDVMILNENDLMYHIPCNQVQEYFASLGFSCPPERNIADYLLDLGTAEQRHYEALNFATKRPRRASEFADIFKCSNIHQEMLSVLEAPHAPELLRAR